MSDAACAHPGCDRDAEYRIEVPGAPRTSRCRWHADAVWRPHRAAATVTALYPDVPVIDPAAASRRPALTAVVLGVLLVLVVVGFAALAPVLL